MSNSTIRNAPLSTQRSAERRDLPDSLLELVPRLRRPRKLLGVSVAPRFRDWHEISSEEGERWLRQSASDGDLYAMARLGMRLIDGAGITQNLDEGLRWLREAAERGSLTAMQLLAVYLFDSADMSGFSGEAQQWLQKVIDEGNPFASVTLATRLITGIGPVPDPQRGERMLRELAARGNQLAGVRLGAHLLSGWYLEKNREEGLRYLRLVAASTPQQISGLGIYLYEKSLAAWRGESRQLAEEAGMLFQEAINQGYFVAELNLAYLIRRNEISEKRYPSLNELLSRHLNQGSSLAQINQALRLAKGVQGSVDWAAADRVVSSLCDVEPVRFWWHVISESGDSEGHLVTGWLCRHELAVDPVMTPLAKRMQLARDGGWHAPQWMSFPAAQVPTSAIERT